MQEFSHEHPRVLSEAEQSFPETAGNNNLTVINHSSQLESIVSIDSSSSSHVASDKVEKPWYELSDEEYDILLPDPLTNVATRVMHGSSSDDDEPL